MAQGIIETLFKEKSIGWFFYIIIVLIFVLMILFRILKKGLHDWKTAGTIWAMSQEVLLSLFVVAAACIVIMITPIEVITFLGKIVKKIWSLFEPLYDKLMGSA